jgi:hypothetical protein
MELLARRKGLHWGPGNASSELPLQAPSAIVIAIGHRHRKRHQDEVYTFSDGELTSSDIDTDPTDSDLGGHDDRQPKRRVSASDFGAPKWTLEEWKMLLSSDDVSDSEESGGDDGRPHAHTDPSKSKTKWSSAKVQQTITRSLRILQGLRKEAPFRALKLPDSIDWLEPELMRGKTLAQCTRSSLDGRKFSFNYIYVARSICSANFNSSVSIVIGILELLGALHYFPSNVHLKAYFDMQIRLILF